MCTEFLTPPPPHSQHRVSEIEKFSSPKMVLLSVLHKEFKQNNPQTTLTPLNLDFEKVKIYLNLAVLLNKFLYFCIF